MPRNKPKAAHNPLKMACFPLFRIAVPFSEHKIFPKTGLHVVAGLTTESPKRLPASTAIDNAPRPIHNDA